MDLLLRKVIPTVGITAPTVFPSVPSEIRKTGLVVALHFVFVSILSRLSSASCKYNDLVGWYCSCASNKLFDFENDLDGDPHAALVYLQG